MQLQLVREWEGGGKKSMKGFICLELRLEHICDLLLFVSRLIF